MNLKPAPVNELNHGKMYGDMAKRAELEPRSDLKPRCPATLTKEERKSWKYYATILKAYGLFSIANAPLLDMLARLTAEAQEFHAKSKGHYMVKDPNNKEKWIVNPYWGARHRNEDKIREALKELGLSSLGMARIGQLAVRKKKESDGFFEG
jgi:phage terminase small subunit